MDGSKIVDRIFKSFHAGMASTTIIRHSDLREASTLTGSEFNHGWAHVHELSMTTPESDEVLACATEEGIVPTQEVKSLRCFDEQIEQLQSEAGEHDEAGRATDDQLKSKGQPKIGDRFSGPKMAKVKDGLGEVKHFVGGLIEHPYEATKHYSILRHSHGMVFYKGPATRIAITIFSDQSLPSDRKLWLQKRGYSGRTGLKVGTLGTRSAWIDVTPTAVATPAQAPKDDERAWQRDIGHFLRKAQEVKGLSNHRPWETDIVGIPKLAQDGYFRIVLCSGRTVLCASPGFRYVSPSTAPGRVRGASLGTLPLEIGVKLGASITNSTVTGAVESSANTVEQTAETKAENAVGL